MDDNNQHIPPLTEQEIEQVWTNAFTRIRKQEKERRSRKIKKLSILSVTLLLILGGILVYNKFLRPDIYSANNKILTIKLADNSQVTLLRGARLTVEKSFPADTRDVFLEGDAVFNVTKSKIHPFIVHTGSYQTKVLGTIFKITQKDSTFNVDLYEGKVQVVKTEKPTEIFTIKPKQTFSNFGSKNVATIVSTKTTNPILKDETATISFRDLKLMDAVKILEDTYGIEIGYPPSASTLKFSVIKEKTTAADIIRLISIKINLNTKKINDKTFQLEE